MKGREQWPMISPAKATMAHGAARSGSPTRYSLYDGRKSVPAAGYFDGTDNSLTIGTQPIYDFTGPFTISMWVNPANSYAEALADREYSNNGYLFVLLPFQP